MKKALTFFGLFFAIGMLAVACNNITQQKSDIYKAIAKLEKQIEGEINTLQPDDEQPQTKNKLNDELKPRLKGSNLAQLQSLLEKVQKDNQGLSEKIQLAEKNNDSHLYYSEDSKDMSIQAAKNKLRYEEILKTLIELRNQISKKQKSMG